MFIFPRIFNNQPQTNKNPIKSNQIAKITGKAFGQNISNKRQKNSKKGQETFDI